MILKLRGSCQFESLHLCSLANTETAFSQGTVTKLVTGMVFHEYMFSIQFYSLHLLFSSKLDRFFQLGDLESIQLTLFWVNISLLSCRSWDSNWVLFI